MTQIFAKITNGEVIKYPYFAEEIRSDHPNVSFSLPFSSESLSAFDIVEVHRAEPPEVDYQHNVVEGVPALQDGAWRQVWVVAAASSEEVAARTQQRGILVREDRNRRLAASDWTQLPDAPVDATAWATYRQALRDVTAQDGFPWDVTWPAPPA